MRNLGQRRVAGEVIEQAVAPGYLNDGTPLRYGYGLALHTYRGLKTVSHGGVDSGYRAEMLWFPETDFGVVVLANLSAIKPGALARRVADLYERDVEYEVRTLSQQVEPILIVGLGALVLVLALGVFLPIWDLGKAAIAK